MGFLLQSKFAALFAHIMSVTGLEVQRPRHYGDLRYRARRVLPTLSRRSDAEHFRLANEAVQKRERRIARNIKNEAAQGR